MGSRPRSEIPVLGVWEDDPYLGKYVRRPGYQDVTRRSKVIIHFPQETENHAWIRGIRQKLISELANLQDFWG